MSEWYRYSVVHVSGETLLQDDARTLSEFAQRHGFQPMHWYPCKRLDGGFGVLKFGVSEVGVVWEAITLEVFMMTDQPPTCPKCGRRIQVWLEGETTNNQVVHCPDCRYAYNLVEE